MSVLIDNDISVPLRDGTILRANVFRPKDDALHPVLLHRTPYGKEGGRSGDLIDAVRAAQSGFVVVIQDVRGRWASEGGAFTPFQYEFEDGADTVAWCTEQPWSNGRVATYGLSYGGYTSWAAAMEQPPGLAAIVPAQSPARVFGDLFYRGGLLNWGLLVGWLLGAGPLVDAVQAMLKGEVAPEVAVGVVASLLDAADAADAHWMTLPLSALPAFRQDPTFAPLFFSALEALVDGPLDRSTSLAPRRDQVDVPAFVIAGWHDLYVGVDIEAYCHLAAHPRPEVSRRSRLLVGPWSHAGFGPVVADCDFGARSTPALLGLTGELHLTLLSWLTATLADQDPGGDEAPIRLFVQGVNAWRSFETWPPPSTATARYLRQDGTLASIPGGPDEAPLTFLYDPAQPCPTVGGAHLPHRRVLAGPRDQQPLLDRDDVLVFTLPVQEAPIEIIGEVLVVLHAATDSVDTDWLVKLCVVDSAGRTVAFTDGVVRARYRNGQATEELLRPDEIVRYDVRLLPTALVVLPGERLRLLVTSSDFPRFDRNLNTGISGAHSTEHRPARQRIYVDAEHPSYVVLPVCS